MADGVNIADANRSFADREWSALLSKNRRHVHEERERRRSQGDQGSQREIAGASIAQTANDQVSAVTFEEPPPSANNNGGAGGAAGFG